MKNFKGIITKIKNNYCIVLTPEGDFMKLTLPKEPVRVGQEITFTPPQQIQWWKYGALVASFLVLFLSLGVFRQLGLNDASAYVSLDINPSIELTLNKHDQVIATAGLNQDGTHLLQTIDWRNKPSGQVLAQIIQAANRQHYIKPDYENIVVVSVTNLTSQPVVESSQVQKELSNSLKNTSAKVKIVAYDTSQEQYREARTAKISVGKLMVYKEAQQIGDHVQLDDLRKASITTLTSLGKITSLDGINQVATKKSVVIMNQGKAVPVPLKRIQERKSHNKYGPDKTHDDSVNKDNAPEPSDEQDSPASKGNGNSSQHPGNKPVHPAKNNGHKQQENAQAGNPAFNHGASQNNGNHNNQINDEPATGANEETTTSEEAEFETDTSSDSAGSTDNESENRYQYSNNNGDNDEDTDTPQRQRNYQRSR